VGRSASQPGEDTTLEDVLVELPVAVREHKETHDALVLKVGEAKRLGASLRQISRAAGISTSRVYNLLRESDRRHISSDASLAAVTAASEAAEGTGLASSAMALGDSGLRIVAFKLNRTYREGMSDDELYETTRRAWRTAPHNHNPDFAFAVAHGIVRAVYRIDRWELVTATRWAFEGEFHEELTEQWAGVDVSVDMGRGSNPVRYMNC
jgi:hypothetical protein